MERARLLGPAVSLIRPLLSVRRAEVLAYLEDIGQHYRTDPSNANADFTRNRLRNELLPLLREKFNPDVDGALNRLSQLAGDAQRVIEKLAEELLDRCTSPGVATPGLYGSSNYAVAAARPTSRRRAGALSLRSQVKLGSSRPKWPCRAVSR